MCEIKDHSESNPSLSRHGQIYYSTNVSIPINGAVPRRPCIISMSDGRTIAEQSGDAEKRPIVYFFALLPLRHLPEMLQMTNRPFIEKVDPHTTLGEILRFFSVILLIAKFKFTRLSDLWHVK